MPLNLYFNNYGAKYNEQQLVADLVVEAIKIMGVEAFYLTNDNDVARDLVYGEDPLKTFTSAFPIEIYPNNIKTFDGENEFFSKFGLEVRNSLTVAIADRTFQERVVRKYTKCNGELMFTRPREGDLIYIPVMNGYGELYEIKFVNQSKDMFTLGRQVPYFYELELENFKYSHEEITTGIPEIDVIQSREAYAGEYTLTDVNGKFDVDDIVYQSPNGIYIYATSTAVVSSYNAVNKTLDLDQIKGTIVTGTLIYNYSNVANAIIVSTDEHVQAQEHNHYDNKEIDSESKNIVNNSEINPLGGI